MFKFTEHERIFFIETRALTKDNEGREVLVGLTLEETEFYMTFSRRFTTGDRDRNKENRKRYLELTERHEKARIDVIGSELYLLNENPPIN